MSRVYSSTNKIRFTDIPEKYAVPRSFKGKLGDVHSEVVIYVFNNYKNTKKYRQKVVDALNYLTYCILQSAPPAFSWTRTDPLNTMPDDIDMDDVEKELGELFLTEDAIQWDVKAADTTRSTDEDGQPNKLPSKEEKTISTESEGKSAKEGNKAEKLSNPVSAANVINRPLKSIRELQKNAASSQKAATKPSSQLTPKEDLYIQPPKYPRFDTSKVWLKQMSGDDMLVIYTTLPEIPTKQNEISVTTNLDAMTERELMNLYPNHIIRTRSARMYEEISGMSFDPDLGVIFPIEGFTEEQVIDNIIQYPHLYRLRKYDYDGKPINFYKSLEVGGQLYPIEEIWDELPESKIIPRDSEYVKEYVVRRYLLEESVGEEHMCKLCGTLDPFLTLFMPPAEYIKRGYKDTLQIVKQCVKSRVRYKQSRNPILKRLKQNA